MSADLALEDLSTIADAIAAGQVTSVQATEACLARIETWQPRTNAFLRLESGQALEQARTMDRELASGKRRSALHGVPMAHKDMYYRSGQISTGGSAIRRDWRPSVTATVLQRLRGGPEEDPRYAALSPQERRILDLIAEGMTNRQIANRLFLAEKTVKNYVSSLLHKLGFDRRTEAGVYAARRRGTHPGAF